MARLTVAVFLIITGVVLLLVTHVLVLVCAIRRGAQLLLRDEERAEASGLTADELGELPCQDFEATTAGTGTGTGGDCAVCLEAFQAGDKCRVLPACQHGFHALCVDSWLRKSRLCPVCRTEVAGCGKVAGSVADDATASVVVAERVGGADRY
uniref:Uncharacterized protein n=1 Tax=Avena sativa TaxID=4498 RepID=A0ACD5Z3C4_AVESA